MTKRTKQPEEPRTPDFGQARESLEAVMEMGSFPYGRTEEASELFRIVFSVLDEAERQLKVKGKGKK